MDEVDTEMDNGMTKKIINRTLYLIYLLTGEEYTLVKKVYNEDLFKQGNPHGSGSIVRSGVSYSFHLPVQNNTEKILELNNQVTQLLTGKGPERREDSAVTFSADEWEFLEGRKDFFSAVLKNKERHALRDIPREAVTEHLATAKKKILQTLFEASSKTQVKGAESGKKRNSAPSVMSLSLPDLPTEQNARNMEFHDSPENSLGPNFHIFDDAPLPEPFACEVCGHTFPYKKNLRIHKRIHSFPFTQPEYGSVKQFRPIRTQNSQAFKCPKCELPFSSESNLQFHMRIHDVKEFSCLECGEIFKSLQLLDSHQTKTTFGEAYPCTTCGKSFIYSNCLLYHQKIHTEKKRFTCALCSKSFANESSLLKHIQKALISQVSKPGAPCVDDDDDDDYDKSLAPPTEK